MNKNLHRSDEQEAYCADPTQCSLIANVAPDGHHISYVNVIKRVLPGSLGPNREIFKDIIRSLLRRQPMLFLMIESHPMTFIISCWFGFVLGVPVGGFLFRVPGATNEHRWKQRLKRLLFNSLRRLPNVSVLTLLPHSLDRRFEQIASGWINDLQLWDLTILDIPATPEANALGEEVTRVANGRRIIVALGSQDRQKGFDYLVELWNCDAKFREKILVVVAGKIRESSRSAASAFAATGGLLIDRKIDDHELIALYRRADFVWNCYVPEYDQASGIFGRAFQLGVPTIVRQGALLSRLGALIGHPTLSLHFGDPGVSVASILDWSPTPPDPRLTAERVDEMREFTRAALLSALKKGYRLSRRTESDT